MEQKHPPFRVTKLHLENFKSCKSTTVDFNDFTCFIGPNNSGKTNVLEGMRFLQAVLRDGLFETVQAWGGMQKLRHLAAAPSSPIVIGVEFEHEGERASYQLAIRDAGEAVAETLHAGSGDGGQPHRILWQKESRPTIRIFQPDHGPAAEYHGANTPLLPSISGASQHAQRVVASIKGWRFYRFSPDRLKAAGPAHEERSLARDGSNFASFLHSVQSRHRRVFGRIEDQLIKSFPEVEEVVSPLVGSQTVVGVREKWFNHAVEGSNLSDGLVGFLAHLVAFYGPDHPTLLVFEEPENYIHARLMERLVEMLRESSKETQCIITTHSVTLLNHMRLEDIRVVDRTDGNTSVRAIPPEGRLLETLSSWGLGDLYFTGELGGVPN